MKVYSAPIPAPDFSPATWQADERAYKAALADHLRKTGWRGPLTGEVVSFPYADGYAQYMVADPPPNTRGATRLGLIHLRLGDGWAIPDAHARGLRKADIVKMVKQEKSLRALFPDTQYARQGRRG